jgi:hypothetical protein
VQLCADYLNGDAAAGVKIKKDMTDDDAREANDPDVGAKIEIDTTDDGTGHSDGVKIKMDRGVATRSGAQAPRYHGLRPQIQVSVALSTLLGVDEQPGEIDGYGPIPAELARRLAADPSGTWRRLVTDDLGHLIDYGRTTYEPPADLAQFVIARDRTCRAPGCERPAAKSDLHHVRWWSRGGHTDAANIVPACWGYLPLAGEDPLRRTRRRLAGRPPSRRNHRLDITHRTHLHSPARGLPRRQHHEDQKGHPRQGSR